MKEFYRRYKSLIDKTFQYILIFLVFFIFIKYVLHYVAPFVLALIISLLLEPFVKMLNKYFKISRALASILIIIGVLTIVIFAGTGIVSKVASEAKSFVENIPSYQEQIKDTYNNIKIKAETYLYLVPQEIQESVSGIFDALLNSVISLLSSGVKSGSINIVSRVPSGVMFVVITTIATFFFMKDRYEIETLIIKKMPTPIISAFRQLKLHTLGALLGYFKAQLMLMCCTGIICLIVLTVIGSPYALLMAIIISIIDALPVFGSGFILWPWALWNLISGNYAFAVGLIINYLAVLLTRQVLEPKFVGEQIGIHPLITLFSIYVGLKIFGVFGFIIGPIIAVLIKAVSTVDK